MASQYRSTHKGSFGSSFDDLLPLVALQQHQIDAAGKLRRTAADGATAKKPNRKRKNHINDVLGGGSSSHGR